MAGSTSSGSAAAAAAADPAAFLSSLPEPLNQYAEAALPLTSSASDVETTAGRRIDELEISVRGHLLTLASALLNSHGGDAAEHTMMDTSGSSSALAAVLTCLRSTIDLCLHIVQLAEALDASDESSASSAPPACYKGMAHPVIRKLPFVLLEDTIDALPPSILKTIWTSGPTDWIADLAAAASSSSPDGKPTADLFQRGSQFLLLKLCNKLLRKLSNRDRDAAFAGSVMTLLAKVFPLSERSAVNVLGTFNVANITDFEDEETFLQHALSAGADGAGDTEDGAMEEDGADQKATENAKKEDKGRDDEEDAESVDYPFYKTFWGVQRVFTDPSIILDGIKDGAASSGGAAAGGGKAPPAAATATAQAFDAQPAMDFVRDVRTVLTALEGRPFPDEVVRQSKSRYVAGNVVLSIILWHGFFILRALFLKRPCIYSDSSHLNTSFFLQHSM